MKSKLGCWELVQLLRMAPSHKPHTHPHTHTHTHTHLHTHTHTHTHRQGQTDRTDLFILNSTNMLEKKHRYIPSIMSECFDLWPHIDPYVMTSCYPGLVVSLCDQGRPYDLDLFLRTTTRFTHSSRANMIVTKTMSRCKRTRRQKGILLETGLSNNT